MTTDNKCTKVELGMRKIHPVRKHLRILVDHLDTRIRSVVVVDNGLSHSETIGILVEHNIALVLDELA